MLKNFPQKDAKQSEIVLFQKYSDVLLKPVSSTHKLLDSEKKTPQFKQESDVRYDNPNLKNLSNLSSEILDAISLQDETDISTEDYLKLEADSANNEQVRASLENDIRTKKMNKDSILSMIFKIVPIGINIVKRGKTLAVGFKDTAVGTVKLIKNLALLSTVIGLDAIEFGFEFFNYLFKLLFCIVTMIWNFPKCLIFYIVHGFLLFALSGLLSILFLFDVFLMVKLITGTSCIEVFIMVLDKLSELDELCYSYFSFHIIRYPESILNMCYRCNSMGNTDRFNRVSSRMFNYIFITIPEKIGGPIGEAITGIRHILNFLDLR